MSEIPAEVCLVRCPKCENLLPEVTDYSVYQCGGCGAVLRARSKPLDSTTASDDENGGVLNKHSEGLENVDFLNRKTKNSSLGFDEDDVKSNGSMKIDKTVEEMCSLQMNQEMEDSEPRINGSRRSVLSSIWRQRNYGFRDSDKISGEVDEGPSKYHFRSHHVYVEPEVEDDRVELLRKLDELKDQIVRSRPLGDKSKEKVSFFNDPIRSQILRRAPVQAPIMPFDQNPYHPYFPGQYVGRDSGDCRQFHNPSCSCLICYTNHHQARPPPPPPPPPPVFYRQDYNDPRFSTLSKPYTRWSGDLHRPRRGILASGGRRCRPLAGGSPFVACCNCFELLQVPNKSTGNTQKKMRCAACSEVILLSVVNKKLVIRNSEKGIGNNKNVRRNTKWSSMESSSEDFDVSGDFDFQSLDRLPLGSRSLTSNKSMRGIRSTSSYTSEDEGELGPIEDPKHVDISIESKKPSSPPSGSPLQDHFDYSTKNDTAASRQNSMKDAAVATEIEILSNEYCVNTGTSQESVDLRNDTGRRESFLVGMIKKSFKLSRSNQHVDHGKVNIPVAITVNGRPLPERLVKKAEKLSGPIQPGHYWYDSRAGFWGMMGGPCRGIIPPLIEEFNYPMPEKCADGHTGVFVNGRELHEKDLDLLASRGLPMDRDRSYIIEISGRVLEEGSGNELQCLGKLAPTVESKKYGFGMKPPKTTT